MNNKPYRPKGRPARRPANALKTDFAKKAASRRLPQGQDTFTRLASAELGVAVVREHRFHPTRRWRFDYAIPSRRIAIEVEGGVWIQGRHTRPGGFLGDVEKYNAAAVLGWRLLRFTPDSLFTGETLRTIRAALDPAPSPPGEPGTG